MTVAPGTNVGVEEPSSAEELPSGAAARVTLPLAAQSLTKATNSSAVQDVAPSGWLWL